MKSPVERAEEIADLLDWRGDDLRRRNFTLWTEQIIREAVHDQRSACADALAPVCDHFTGAEGEDISCGALEAAHFAVLHAHAPGEEK